MLVIFCGWREELQVWKFVVWLGRLFAIDDLILLAWEIYVNHRRCGRLLHEFDEVWVKQGLVKEATASRERKFLV